MHIAAIFSSPDERRSAWLQGFFSSKLTGSSNEWMIGGMNVLMNGWKESRPWISHWRVRCRIGWNDCEAEAKETRQMKFVLSSTLWVRKGSTGDVGVSKIWPPDGAAKQSEECKQNWISLITLAEIFYEGFNLIIAFETAIAGHDKRYLFCKISCATFRYEAFSQWYWFYSNQSIKVQRT